MWPTILIIYKYAHYFVRVVCVKLYTHDSSDSLVPGPGVRGEGKHAGDGTIVTTRDSRQRFPFSSSSILARITL